MDFGESVLYCANGNDTGDGRTFKPVMEEIQIEIMINDRFEKRMKAWDTVNFGFNIFLDKDFYEKERNIGFWSKEKS